MMKTALQLSLAAAAATLATSQDICSCTPTAYSIELNFDAKCETSTGLDSNGSGVEGSICFFTQGGNPEDIDEEFALGGNGRTRQLRRELAAKRSAVQSNWFQARATALSGVDLSSHIAHAQQRLEQMQQQQPKQPASPSSSSQFTTRHLQDRQDLDTTPTVITSVTFLEQDTTPELNIINQDSTYFSIEASDGDILDFTSITAKLDPSVPLSDQMDMVPGGVLIISFGINADGAIVQNTVAWGYQSDYCDGVSISEGAGVGWVMLDGYTPPQGAFCDGVTDAPTVSPTTTASKAPTVAGDIASKSSKSQGVFAKAAKKQKEETVDAKAEKMGKMSMPSAKATKVFKLKGKSAKKGGVASSAKGEPKAEPSMKALYVKETGSAPEKSVKGTSGSADAKAGKVGSEDETSAKGGSTMLSGKASKPGMSMPSAGPAPVHHTKGSSAKGSSAEAKASKEKMSMPPKVSSGKGVKEAKATKGGEGKATSDDTMDAKASKEKMSMPPKVSSGKGVKEAKATKVFKTKEAKAEKTGEESSKAGKGMADMSMKGSADAKALKESPPKSTAPSSKAEKSDDPSVRPLLKTKASKMSDMSMPDDPSVRPLLVTTKASKMSDMSMPAKGHGDKAPSAKGGDAKAEKGPSSKGTSDESTLPSSMDAKAHKASDDLFTKGSKMSMPSSAKAEKKHGSNSKSGKAKTSKAGSADAKAEKTSGVTISSSKSMKADPINTSQGYVQVVEGKPE